MTVIATVIGSRFTSHASDSLITKRKSDGTLEVLKWEGSKIVPVRHWRGAFAFWGLAEIKPGISTYDWLREKVKSAPDFDSPEQYAHGIAKALNTNVSSLRSHPGIGIHFTAYEYIDGFWIPELFLISDFEDPSYTALRPMGVGVSRETRNPNGPEIQRTERHRRTHRLSVHDYLQAGGFLTYNNGDPQMYNPVAHAIRYLIQLVVVRGNLKKPNNWETYTALARRPIEFISDFQRDFSKPNTRLVGGKVHDLAISPGGEFFSTSGDNRLA